MGSESHRADLSAKDFLGSEPHLVSVLVFTHGSSLLASGQEFIPKNVKSLLARELQPLEFGL